jgi:chemotaxis protein MotB
MLPLFHGGPMAGKARDRGSVIIKKYEIVEGGHHGGAWKVAYADFVTAMMAFFLLMWLLNATSEDQRKGLADFFTPSNEISRGSSGSGQPFGGRTPFEQGELVSDRGAQTVIEGKAQAVPEDDDPDAEKGPQRTAGGKPARPPGGDGAEDAMRDPKKPTALEADGAPGGTAAAKARVQSQALGQAQALANAGDGTNTPAAMQMAPPDEAALKAEADRREREAFEQATQQIKDAIRADPRLADLLNQLTIDQTPEGLRIQLLDEEKKPMFATGSAVLADHAKLLLAKIAPILAKLPEGISIAGHTDAAPFKGGERSNWELSAERANATRRLLVDAGLAEKRIRHVAGNADRDPLLPADPFAAANRRIAILVLRAAPAR